MAILVNDIISRVQSVLQDTTGVRWPQTELVLWINDAQREVALLKPDAMSNTAIATLDTGTKQSIFYLLRGDTVFVVYFSAKL